MRKRNFAFCLDNLFWWIVYLLPVFAWLIYLSSLQYQGASVLSFGDFMCSNLFWPVENNIFLTTIQSIFGSDGILPLFDYGMLELDGVLYYLSYFVTVYFVHLCIDVIMLLPRLVMRAMDKLGGQD